MSNLNKTKDISFFHTAYRLRFLGDRSKNKLNKPHDRTNKYDFKTDLHFLETSSRPSKATLKVVKIDTFSQTILQVKREIDRKYLKKKFLDIES